MHLPAGFLIARYGLRKTLPLAILISALGFIPINYSDNWVVLILGRVLMGASSSFGIAAAFYMLSGVSLEKFGARLAMTFCSGLSAAILGGSPLAHCLQTFGFTCTVNALSVIGIALAVIALALPKIIISNTKKVTLKDVKAALTNHSLLWLSFTGALISSAAVFSDTWGARFLSMKYNISPIESAQLTTCIFMGRIVGYPLCTILLKHINATKLALCFGSAMSCLFFFLIISPPLPYYLCCGLFLLMGFFYCYIMPSLYTASQQVDPKIVVLALSLWNLSAMVVFYITDLIVGLSIDTFGNINNLQTFQNALLIIPIICGAGVINFYFIRKKII